MQDEEAEAFANAILDCKKKIKYCSICGNYTVSDVCDICKERSSEIVCVVKEPKDIIAMEKLGDFKGVYHVLHGTIKPTESVGPKDLSIDALIERVKNNAVKEVVMATNPDFDGEITAMYISNLLKPLGVKVTRS